MWCTKLDQMINSMSKYFLVKENGNNIEKKKSFILWCTNFFNDLFSHNTHVIKWTSLVVKHLNEWELQWRKRKNHMHEHKKKSWQNVLYQKSQFI